MGSEQVAQVLRLCGNRVKLVVTRGPLEEGPSVAAVMPVVLPTVNEQVRGLLHFEKKREMFLSIRVSLQ